MIAMRVPKLPPTPEKAIMHGCLQWLSYRQIVAWRMNSGAMKGINATTGRVRYVQFNSARGMSDILAILPGGRLAAIEVKSASGKVTAQQEDFLQRVRDAGGVGIVVRSIDELEAAMREMGTICTTMNHVRGETHGDTEYCQCKTHTRFVGANAVKR